MTPDEALARPERLTDLRAAALLDTPAEELFDRISRVIQQTLLVPVATVTLVDQDRQFWKSQVGLPEPWATRRQTPLSHSFCQWVVNDDAALVVDDALEDERLRDNLAIEDLGVRAYAGAPLRGLHGEPLGAVCAIDIAPRDWSAAEVALVEDLAALASELVALRSAALATRGAVLELSHQVRTGLAAARLEASQLDGADTAGLDAALDRVSDAVASTLGKLENQPRPGRPVSSSKEALTAAAARGAARAALAGRTIRVGKAEGDAPVRAGSTELATVLDGMVDVLLEHGSGPVTLSLVPGEHVVRLRVEDESEALPADVAGQLAVRSDAPDADLGDPSLAERAARTLRARLLVGAGSLDLVLPPA